MIGRRHRSLVRHGLAGVRQYSFGPLICGHTAGRFFDAASSVHGWDRVGLRLVALLAIVVGGGWGVVASRFTWSGSDQHRPARTTVDD